MKTVITLGDMERRGPCPMARSAERLSLERLITEHGVVITRS